MKRKIIKQSDRAYTMTLPIDWVRGRGIKPGDEIEVQEAESSLIITTKTIVKDKEITIDIQTDNEDAIRVTLANLYRLGYDKITVRCASNRQADQVIQTADSLLLGLELTERRANTLRLEMISEPGDEKQEALLRRVFLMIKSTFEEIETSLREGKAIDINLLQKDKIKTDQYVNFLWRSISKRRMQGLKSYYYWSLYGYLSLLEHSLVRLTPDIDKETSKNKQIREVFHSINQQYQLTYESFFANDPNGIHKAIKDSRPLLKLDLKGVLSNCKGKDHCLLHQFSETTRIIYVMTSPMLGIIL